MGDGNACLNAMSSQIELYDYPWEFDACFNNNDEYMCGQAANMYPELMEQLLSENNTEGPWVEYCLMGDGYACLNAMSSQIELYDYPWEFDACFNNNDEYMCGQAVNMYPELMEQLLTTSCYSWTDSEGSLLSDQESVSDLSAGTYTFAYSNGECSYSQSFEVGLSCSGCTDASAFNYNENANLDDSSCIAVVTGCMDATAFNFNPDANTADDSCVPVVMGCIDNAFMEYDEAANTDDGSCDVIKVFGCMDSTPNLMSNYNPEANTDDGSCVSWEDLANTLHGQLDNIVPEDGIGQADIDSAYADGVASVEVPECEEVATQNIPLDLPEGWSMFGYTCMDSLDAVAGFSEIADKIEIVKDEWGLAYITEWGFNGLGSLHFSEGYQIKMIEGVDGFQFCSTITPEDGITQADLDALAASYAGWCESDTDNDGICDVDEVWGCMDNTACNFVADAEFDDSSCYNNDLGCGCDTPAAADGYDCDGNELPEYQIGVLVEGGIVFQINEDGTGLVADLQDLGQMDWYDAMDAAQNATSQGYDDWYLPSLEELELMYNTIGNGGPEGNIGGFSNYFHWSSSEYSNIFAWLVNFNGGNSYYYNKSNTYRVLVIRAF
jgi:hypothetical protein